MSAQLPFSPCQHMPPRPAVPAQPNYKDRRKVIAEKRLLNQLFLSLFPIIKRLFINRFKVTLLSCLSWLGWSY